MKDKIRETSLVVVLILTIGTAIFSAVTIGDQLTRYNSFKTLISITKLARPIHALINELQVERTLASRYMSVKDQTLLPEVNQQYQKTDHEVGKFAKGLKITELLLLSIPEAELTEKAARLKAEREKLTEQKPIFYKQFVYYNRLVDDLMSFQDKMFTYADGEEYKPVIQDLIHAESLKEALAQEQAFAAYHLTPPVIQRGEFPLILQEISNQVVQDDNLKSSLDPKIQAKVNEFYHSKEYAKLEELRKQFLAEKPDLKGSVARGEDYIRGTSGTLSLLRNLNQGIQLRLENIAREGKAKVKSELIWTTIFALVALLSLVGVHVWIRNLTSPSETAQS